MKANSSPSNRATRAVEDNEGTEVPATLPPCADVTTPQNNQNALIGTATTGSTSGMSSDGSGGELGDALESHPRISHEELDLDYLVKSRATTVSKFPPTETGSEMDLISKTSNRRAIMPELLEPDGCQPATSRMSGNTKGTDDSLNTDKKLKVKASPMAPLKYGMLVASQPPISYVASSTNSKNSRAAAAVVADDDAKHRSRHNNIDDDDIKRRVREGAVGNSRSRREERTGSSGRSKDGKFSSASASGEAAIHPGAVAVAGIDHPTDDQTFQAFDEAIEKPSSKPLYKSRQGCSIPIQLSRINVG